MVRAPAFTRNNRMPRRRGSRRVTAVMLTLTWVASFAGCAAFHPVRGVPAVYLPEDYLGEERSGRETINLSLLVRSRPEQHHIEAGDLLSIFIPGILGSVNHTDNTSGENPPISNPLGRDLLPTIGYPILVQDDHTIALPYLPSINVYGLTTEQAAERIRQTALSLGILRAELGKDRVLVTLQQPRQYRVLVVRQEAMADASANSQPGSINVGTSKRGTAQLVSLRAYENDVLHALMGEQGNTGLPGLDAKNFIYVIRNRRPQAGYHGMPVQGGAPQFGVPQQPGGQVPSQYGYPTGSQPAGQSPSSTYYPQPTPAVAPSSYRQPQAGVIIRGQSDLLPVSHWTPAEHFRQSQQLDPRPMGGHSIQFVAQTTPPVWNGQSPIPAPAPSPISGGHSPIGAPNPLAVPTSDVPMLHPSLDPAAVGSGVLTQPLPIQSQPVDVPLLHPSLAPQSSELPIQAGPGYVQTAPPTGNAPASSPQMQWQPGVGAYPTQNYEGYRATSGYIDPAIQQMAAMQGTPFDQQWAATLGNWSPTVEGPDIIKIPVRLGPGEMPYLTEEDITLCDGDIVFIESRDSEVFYTGGLLGGGQYTLPRDNDLRVTQAISIASANGQNSGVSRSLGGVSALNQDVSCSASRVVILRTLPCGQRVRVEVDLYRAFHYEDEDILILPGDMILLQYKCHEACAAFLERYLLEGALFGIAAGSLTNNGGSN